MRDIDVALHCEVWMLSRVKNYMQDSCKASRLCRSWRLSLPMAARSPEFLQTSSRHPPQGSWFLQLELSYIRVVPEVAPISPTPKPALTDTDEEEPENNADDRVRNGKEHEKVEFPDLNLAEAAAYRSARRRDQILTFFQLKYWKLLGMVYFFSSPYYFGSW